MTGDQALQCMELAILRVRDKAMRSFPRDDGLLSALTEIAGHLAEFQLLAACARPTHRKEADGGKG